MLALGVGQLRCPRRPSAQRSRTRSRRLLAASGGDGRRGITDAGRRPVEPGDPGARRRPHRQQHHAGDRPDPDRLPVLLPRHLSAAGGDPVQHDRRGRSLGGDRFDRYRVGRRQRHRPADLAAPDRLPDVVLGCDPGSVRSQQRRAHRTSRSPAPTPGAAVGPAAALDPGPAAPSDPVPSEPPGATGPPSPPLPSPAPVAPQSGSPPAPGASASAPAGSAIHVGGVVSGSARAGAWSETLSATGWSITETASPAHGASPAPRRPVAGVGLDGLVRATDREVFDLVRGRVHLRGQVVPLDPRRTPLTSQQCEAGRPGGDRRRPGRRRRAGRRRRRSGGCDRVGRVRARRSAGGGRGMVAPDRLKRTRKRRIVRARYRHVGRRVRAERSERGGPGVVEG